jgi:hypothetical protein
MCVTGEAVWAASRRIAAGEVAEWAGKLAERARPVVRQMGEIYGPVLAETFTRYERGRVCLRWLPFARPPSAR